MSSEIENTNIGNGIELMTGFDLKVQKPIDSRLTVSTYDGLAALVNGNVAYLGMQVYVTNENATYERLDGGWARLVGRTTPEGGEIFGDYEGNKAYSPFSAAAGVSTDPDQKKYTFAGVKGFKIRSVINNNDDSTATIIVRGDASDLPPGAMLSYDGGSHFSNCLKCNSVAFSEEDNETTIEVDRSKLPIDIKTGKIPELTVDDGPDNEKDQVENWLWYAALPEYGEQNELSRGAYAHGENVIAIGRGANATGRESKAIGHYSHAEGRQTEARYASHAEGYDTHAEGMFTHTEGTRTRATGYAAHAEGEGGEVITNSGIFSESSGRASHTEGIHAIASGRASHAEGETTKASGRAAHSEGWGTKAAGNAQHVQGKYNIEDNDNIYAHIVGNGTDNIHRNNIHTLDWDGNAWYAGTLTAEGEIQIYYSEDGTKPKEHKLSEKANQKDVDDKYLALQERDEDLQGDITGLNLRVEANKNELKNKLDKTGYITAGQVDGAPLGTKATAEGENTAAIGRNSHAGGYQTIAQGENSYAQGISDKPYNEIKDRTGTFDQKWNSANCWDFLAAAGAGSHAEGHNALASGQYAHAEGDTTQASGYASHAEGGKAQGSSGYTKYGPRATGRCSHAEGGATSALGDYCHAEGKGSTAEGTGSHAEGTNSKAKAIGSHAEGQACQALNNGAHAEGNQSIAEGSGSHAEGYSCQAQTQGSHAEGQGTIANKSYQHVQGKYNDHTVSTDTGAWYIHVVGNGTSDTERANAHTIDTQGNGAFFGAVSSKNGDYAEFFEWMDGNPKSEDRIALAVTLIGDKITLANPGDNILGIVSGTVAVLGDNPEWSWKNKYVTDKFGRIIYDQVEEFITDIDPETGEEIQISLGFFPHPRINPDYDPTQTYISREERPEWDKVGMLGKLYALDDSTCIPGAYATAGINGVLTYSSTPTNIYVMKRTAEDVVWVLFK